MPAKRGVFHANIDPWNIYPTHILQRWNLKQRVWLLLEVSKIPRVVSIRLIALLILHAKSVTKSLCVEVCSIFYFDFLTNLILNHVPVAWFNFFINFLVLRPVNISVICLSLMCNFLKLSKCMALNILIKGYSLWKFL